MATFTVYEDTAQPAEWRWRLQADNGRITADSGEGYTRAGDCRDAVARVQRLAPTQAIDGYVDNAGEHRWRLRANNNEILADSGEGYTRAGDRDDAIARFRRDAPTADVVG